MTILIKGMEMPETCYKCKFALARFDPLPTQKYKRHDFECVLTEKTLTSTKRNRACPLVPVPTPHGRLIEAGALLERFEKEEKAADEHGRDFSFSFKSGGENCTEWWPVQQMLMDAPTVIEAEK